MIDKSFGHYFLLCDVCNNEADEAFYNFGDAVDFKKSNGWKSQTRNGAWEDVCPQCQG